MSDETVVVSELDLDDLDYEALLPLIAEVSGAFSPSAPINQRDLFAGRAEQMVRLMDVASETGQHAVLYGERGVGKTSLAAVMTSILQRQGYVAVRVNCQAGDTFSTIWRKVFKEITLTQRVAGAGFNSTAESRQVSFNDVLGPDGDLTPEHVRAALSMVAATTGLVAFVDEFDRVVDQATHTMFADLIKTLSDHAVAATIVLVGVADNVDDLIREHASVERGLAQIAMPRMSAVELRDVVLKALGRVGMGIESQTLGRITALSQGLPHYTHLMGQQAAAAAIERRSANVSNADLTPAFKQALKRSQESVQALYYRATYSARENLYKQVLLGCALAQADDRGFFSAATVRDSLSKVMKRPMDIPQFAMHLNAFSSDRGPVLRKEGSQRKFRYRFINPLLQPHVIMRGIEDGLISADQLDHL